jgi:alkylation response protein AidB-like acyl-CoA dehydrogenase
MILQGAPDRTEPKAAADGLAPVNGLEGRSISQLMTLTTRVQRMPPWARADLRALARTFDRAARRTALQPSPGRREFPEAGFGLLRDLGLHAPAVRSFWGGLPDATSRLEPAERADLADLLYLLRAVGRVSLPLGRLYEGHLNALQLIGLFGSPAQRASAQRDLEDGLIFAVWNSDSRQPLRLDAAGSAAFRLRGGKAFASGAGRVERPIVTATLPDGRRQMVLLDDRLRDATIAPGSWEPLGMEASASFEIDLSGLAVGVEQLLGEPDEYQREPWFSAGAIRFAAVQLGGAEALFELTRTHLRERQRDCDPHQIARVAGMAIALESGAHWLERAAEQADQCTPGQSGNELTARAVAYAHMARTAIERICLDVQESAIRSVGAAGLLRPHPMEQIVRDLTMYLRQPAPDAALAAVGRHVLQHDAVLPELWAAVDDR